MAASLGILVIRSSLADWQSMKKECRHARHKYIAKKGEILHTLYLKSYLCVPRNETARPRSQFLHLFICEQFIYIPRIGLPIGLQQNRQTAWEYLNGPQIHECGNWETEHYNSVLEITGRTVSFLGTH